jgi:hypothetical protein
MRIWRKNDQKLHFSPFSYVHTIAHKTKQTSSESTPESSEPWTRWLWLLKRESDSIGNGAFSASIKRALNNRSRRNFRAALASNTWKGNVFPLEQDHPDLAAYFPNADQLTGLMMWGTLYFWFRRPSACATQNSQTWVLQKRAPPPPQPWGAASTSSPQNARSFPSEVTPLCQLYFLLRRSFLAGIRSPLQPGSLYRHPHLQAVRLLRLCLVKSNRTLDSYL